MQTDESVNNALFGIVKAHDQLKQLEKQRIEKEQPLNQDLRGMRQSLLDEMKTARIDAIELKRVDSDSGKPVLIRKKTVNETRELNPARLNEAIEQISGAQLLKALPPIVKSFEDVASKVLQLIVDRLQQLHKYQAERLEEKTARPREGNVVSVDRIPARIHRIIERMEQVGKDRKELSTIRKQEVSKWQHTMSEAQPVIVDAASRGLLPAIESSDGNGGSEKLSVVLPKESEESEKKFQVELRNAPCEPHKTKKRILPKNIDECTPLVEEAVRKALGSMDKMLEFVIESSATTVEDLVNAIWNDEFKSSVVEYYKEELDRFTMEQGAGGADGIQHEEPQRRVCVRSIVQRKRKQHEQEEQQEEEEDPDF